MVNNAPLVHVSGYAKGMTQATDCATDFTVTEDMRARYLEWVDKVVAATTMPRSELLIEHEPWMHPLDAIAIITVHDESPLSPEDRAQYANALRTSAGFARREWRAWVARAMGTTPETVKKYELDRVEYDVQGPAAVYRFYDEDSRLLYVGIAKDPDKREREHEGSLWHRHAARREDRWHGSRPEALSEERRAIRTELPVFNLHGSAVAPDEPEEYLMWKNLDLIAEAVTR